eukprot:gene28821-32010_t
MLLSLSLPPSSASVVLPPPPSKRKRIPSNYINNSFVTSESVNLNHCDALGSVPVLDEVIYNDAIVGNFLGHVKWFNDRLGYGFCTVISGPDIGKDIFVHHGGIQPLNSNYKTLRKGEYINFNMTTGHTGLQASDVTGINGGPLMCDVVPTHFRGRTYNMMIDVDNPVWDIVNSSRAQDPLLEYDPSSGGIQCTYCNVRSHLATIDGLVTCSGCNSVLDRLIDYGAEWRYYTSEAAHGGGVDTTRCCPPSNILLPTLGSIIMHGCYNNSGNRGTCAQTQGKPHLLLNNKLADGGEGEGADECDGKGEGKDEVEGDGKFRYHMWSSMSYRERSLCSVFEQLSLIALRNGIPHIILEEAKCLYKKVSAIKVTRGDNRKALVACSMYMACKFNKVPRNTKEIAELFEISSRVITRGCKLFQQAVDVDIDSSRPEDYIRRFCSRLHMDSTELEFTEYIVLTADELDIVCDFIPTSVVSGAIYMTATELNVSISKSDIANVCHISEMTLMKCYKRLCEHRGAILAGLNPSDNRILPIFP